MRRWRSASASIKCSVIRRFSITACFPAAWRSPAASYMTIRLKYRVTPNSIESNPVRMPTAVDSAETAAEFVLTAGSVHAAGTTPFSLTLARRAVGITSPKVAPDGKTVAFVVSRPNYADDRNESELYVLELPSGAPRALTFERRQVSEP